MVLRNIRLLLEYDGKNYAGWQLQNGTPTVQGALQNAIEKLTGKASSVVVAGRTDAGVHAVSQVCNFRTESRIDLERYTPGLNHYLPDDISVHQSAEVDLEFHARHDAKRKHYRYRIYRGPQPAALESRAWNIRAPLDVGAMRSGAKHLVGELDFESFRSVHCDAAHARRTMISIDIEQRPRPPLGEHVDIDFVADSYCRHMCRIIAGTLVETGLGKRDPSEVKDALDSRDRTTAGVTAPPTGLTLMPVFDPP